MCFPSLIFGLGHVNQWRRTVRIVVRAALALALALARTLPLALSPTLDPPPPAAAAAGDRARLAPGPPPQARGPRAVRPPNRPPGGGARPRPPLPGVRGPRPGCGWWFASAGGRRRCTRRVVCWQRWTGEGGRERRGAGSPHPQPSFSKACAPT